MTGPVARVTVARTSAARAVLAVLVGVALLRAGAAAAAAPADTPSRPAGPVVVVGVPGLTWSDVDPDRTPTLWRLVGEGSAGALSVRSAADATCAADGWLSLGAGDRALATPASADSCPQVPEPAAVPDLVAANAELGYRARIGLLAEQVDAGGGCVTAVGAGAALAAADREGQVATRFDDAAADTAGTADSGLAAALRACPVTLVEAPADPAAADALLARVDAARPAPSTLIVAGVGAAPGTALPRDTLQVAVEVGPEVDAGRALVSPSTRRAPYVQLIDVTPTVLARTGAGAGARVAGQPWQSTGEALPPEDRVAALVDADRLAVAHRRTAVPAAAVLAGVPALLLAACAVAARRRPGSWPRRLAGAVGLVAGGVPVATYLAMGVPWWRAGVPLAALLAVVTALAAALGAAAALGPWRRRPLGPAGVVAGVTAVVLAADVMTGSRLQMSSVLGHSPLVAGRFAGFSNLAFGVLAASVLVAAAAVAAALRPRDQRPIDQRPRDQRDRSRQVQRLAVAAVVAAGVLVVGVPGWGSDVGGVLALVPAGVLLVLLATGARVSPRRLLLAAGSGVAVVALLAAADAARPAADQTHLGRFALQVARGEAGPVLARKASANLALLTDNPATAAVPVLLAALAVLVLRPGRARAPALARAYAAVPELRAALVSVLAVGVLGALANDSGVAVPAAAFLVAGPLALAVVLRATSEGSAAAAGPGDAPGPGGPAVGWTSVDKRDDPLATTRSGVPGRAITGGPGGPQRRPNA